MRLVIADLRVDQIFNWMAPDNVTAWNFLGGHYGDVWHEPHTIEIRRKFGKQWMCEFDSITGHFTKLKKSIVQEGMRNPISVVTGPLRDWVSGQISRDQRPFPNDVKVYTSPFGGSRLTVAAELGITEVRCLVHDYNGEFDGPTVSKETLHQWFDTTYFFTNLAPYVRTREMNGETRTAQNLATSRVKRQQDWFKWSDEWSG